MGKVGIDAPGITLVQSHGVIRTSKVDVFFTAKQCMPLWVTVSSNGGTGAPSNVMITLNDVELARQVVPEQPGLFSGCSATVALMLEPGDKVKLHIATGSALDGSWRALSTEKVEFK